MSPETVQKLLKELDRLRFETGAESHEVVIARARALSEIPLFLALFPLLDLVPTGDKTPEGVQACLDLISTPDKFRKLLLGLDEPPVEALDSAVSILNSFVPSLQRKLKDAQASLKQHRGPPKKTPTDKRLREIVDQIEQARRGGEPVMSLYLRFAGKLGIAPRTLRRKYKEEMMRRESLADPDVVS